MTTRKNSMAEIIVRYGQEQKTLEDELCGVIDEICMQGPDNHDSCSKESERKETTLPKFLKIDPKSLSEDERKVQSVLKDIYELNGDIGIYPIIPKKNGKSLCIDLTACLPKEKGADGVYARDMHAIEMLNIVGFQEKVLTRILSHELMHVYQEIADTSHFNNYQNHQWGFYIESQADACATGVVTCLHTDAPNYRLMRAFVGREAVSASFKKKRDQWTLQYLRNFFKSSKYHYYKEDYDRCYPIHRDDKPLPAMPAGFPVANADQVLQILNENVSRVALTPMGKLWQAIENSDQKALLILLKSKDRAGNPLIPDTEMDLINENIVEACEKQKKTGMLETYLKSGRVSQDDVDYMFLSLVIPHKGKATQDLFEIRTKMMDVLIGMEGPDGSKVLTNTQIERGISYAEMVIEMRGNNDAKVFFNNMAKHIRSIRNIPQKCKTPRSIRPPQATPEI
ncbi:MAG: hypothetical protein IKS41_00530 [Alphaproteobacteria bacterium]|nr:hypothetical protein [Alphaproteobacteria bacterium]